MAKSFARCANDRPTILLSKMSRENRKKKIVVVSGGFDPIHVGHIRLFQEAKKLGDKLVVILNNDNWLRKKKGYVFMLEKERKEILEAIKEVDRVILTRHSKEPINMTVATELRRLKPNVFANGGDRNERNIPELAVCGEIGCRIVFNVGKSGKTHSSSRLVANFAKE